MDISKILSRKVKNWWLKKKKELEIIRIRNMVSRTSLICCVVGFPSFFFPLGEKMLEIADYEFSQDNNIPFQFAPLPQRRNCFQMQNPALTSLININVVGVILS